MPQRTAIVSMQAVVVGWQSSYSQSSGHFTDSLYHISEIYKDKSHENIPFWALYIWRTALNLFAAQTPRCELCKRGGLCPSCLSHEDKTCIFRTLLVLWKGHRLVWNIKQLVLSEIKKDFGREWEVSKRLWWYISLNLQKIWQDEKIKTGEQRASQGGGRQRLFFPPLCSEYAYIIIPQSERLALKMSRFLTEKTRKRETEIETKIGEMGHQMFQVIRHTQVI